MTDRVDLALLSQPVQRRQIRYFHARPVLHGRAHGRRGTYNDGCRCDDCTDAEAIYNRQGDRVS